VNILALEADLATRWLIQHQNQFGRGGFTAPGFSDQPQRFSTAYGIRNPIDGFYQADGLLQHQALRHWKMLLDIT
jgi:hypothetical protein